MSRVETELRREGNERGRKLKKQSISRIDPSVPDNEWLRTTSEKLR